jgi:hypothetical protein
MTYPDGIDALVNVNAGDTLAAGGHAARHNSVNTALVEVKDYLGPALADKVAYPTGGSDGDLLAKDGTAAEWIAVPEAGLTFITAESFSAVSFTNANLQSIAGSVNSTTQCDGITILTDTGTITGTIRVYGYKD